METQTRLSRHNKFISAENITIRFYINKLSTLHNILQIYKSAIYLFIIIIIIW